MFDELKKRLKNPKSVEFATCFIFALLTFILVFHFFIERIDTTPAEQKDIDYLTKIASSVSEDPSNLLNNDGKIEIRNGITTYSISNTQCSVVAKYDENYNIIELEVEDLAFPVFAAICLAIFIAFLLFLAVGVALALVISIISILYMAIFRDYEYIE